MHFSPVHIISQLWKLSLPRGTRGFVWGIKVNKKMSVSSFVRQSVRSYFHPSVRLPVSPVNWRNRNRPFLGFWKKNERDFYSVKYRCFWVFEIFFEGFLLKIESVLWILWFCILKTWGSCEGISFINCRGFVNILWREGSLIGNHACQLQTKSKSIYIIDLQTVVGGLGRSHCDRLQLSSYRNLLYQNGSIC